MKILALDIGGSKLMAAPVDIHTDRLEIGRIAHRSVEPDCSKEQLLDLIDQAVEELGPIDFQRIGTTIPGLADPQRGIWVYAPFSGICDFPIAKILSEKYDGRPVLIDNDVNACALAEKKFGACKKLNDFLWITVSNGVGGGLVLEGKIYPGHFGGAAEIGHFVVVEGSEAMQCSCGNFGCLEAEAAGPGITKRYHRLLEQNGLKPQKTTAKKIADLARSGDESAFFVMQTTASLLGKAASYAVNLMNLEAIVFGGGVMESFDLFQPELEATFQKHLFRSANSSVRILKTGLGYQAALAGAATLTLDFD